MILDDPKVNKQGRKTYRQGLYRLKHPQKYTGNPQRVVYRSSWELYFNMWCDSNANIVRWCHEPFPIPYMNPIDKKAHRYFVDYFVEVKTRSGMLRKFLVEIKPDSQTRQSIAKRAKTRLKENYTYIINDAKWTSAKIFAGKHGMNFMLLTEKQLFAAFRTM